MAMKINQTQLLELKKFLKKTAKTARPKTYDVDAALDELRPEIITLREKGFDATEIAALVKGNGLSVSPTRINKFLAASFSLAESEKSLPITGKGDKSNSEKAKK